MGQSPLTAAVGEAASSPAISPGPGEPHPASQNHDNTAMNKPPGLVCTRVTENLPSDIASRPALYGVTVRTGFRAMMGGPPGNRGGLLLIYLRFRLPAAHAGRLLPRATAATPPTARVAQLRLLRMVEPGVRAAHALQHAHRLRLRTSGGRTRAAHPTTPRRPDRLHRHEPRSAWILQVLQLRAGELQRAGERVGRRPPAVGHLLSRHAAARHQLLHLPVDERHHRHLPRSGAPALEHHRFRLLRGAVPTAGRRSDCQVPRGVRPASQPGAHLGQVRAGGIVRRLRHGEESHAGKPGGQGRRHLLRSWRAARRRRVVWPGGVCLPDLLRLQRLQRHGDRARPDAGIRVSEELRLAVSRPVNHRVLAAVAPVTLVHPTGLPLSAARWKPQGAAPHLREPDDRDAAGRAVARRLVELRHLGRHPRRHAGV